MNQCNHSHHESTPATELSAAQVWGVCLIVLGIAGAGLAAAVGSGVLILKAAFVTALGCQRLYSD